MGVFSTTKEGPLSAGYQEKYERAWRCLVAMAQCMARACGSFALLVLVHLRSLLLVRLTSNSKLDFPESYTP